MIGESTGGKTFRPIGIIFRRMPHHLRDGQAGTPKGTATIFAPGRTAVIFGNGVLGSNKMTAAGVCVCVHGLQMKDREMGGKEPVSTLNKFSSSKQSLRNSNSMNHPTQSTTQQQQETIIRTASCK